MSKDHRQSTIHESVYTDSSFGLAGGCSAADGFSAAVVPASLLDSPAGTSAAVPSSAAGAAPSVTVVPSSSESTGGGGRTADGVHGLSQRATASSNELLWRKTPMMIVMLSHPRPSTRHLGDKQFIIISSQICALWSTHTHAFNKLTVPGQ